MDGARIRMSMDTAIRFGPGGSEPYERAIEHGGGDLRLVAAHTEHRTFLTAIDVSRFSQEADAVDRDALARTSGPVLDIGCGPGRIVKAAIAAHRPSLGIDLSPAAVARAHSRGLPVLRRSVFHAVPSCGRWTTVVLLDGNIGIGGDPERLLRRCRELMAPDGDLLVETHSSERRAAAFDAVLLDSADLPSLPFPWAEVGAAALAALAVKAGLIVRSSWTADGRHFSLLGHE